MPNVIYGFANEYRFLSNFWDARITFPYMDGPLGTPLQLNAKTVEHAYQASKSTNTMEVLAILAAKTPGEAKKLGSQIKHLRPDWERVKVGTMYILNHLKYTQNIDLAKKLLSTGAAKLVEANWWGDSFWGVDRKTGKGDNMLGQVLMLVRNDLVLVFNELVAENKAFSVVDFQKSHSAVFTKNLLNANNNSRIT